LSIEAADAARADRELVRVQLDAWELARIERARAAGTGAPGRQVQPLHHRDHARLIGKVGREEYRSRDRRAVDVDLPIAGPAPHGQAAAAERLAERREVADL